MEKDKSESESIYDKKQQKCIRDYFTLRGVFGVNQCTGDNFFGYNYDHSYTKAQKAIAVKEEKKVNKLLDNEGRKKASEYFKSICPLYYDKV